jgi:hypothetical protein
VSLCNHLDITLFGDAKCTNRTIKRYTESFLRTTFSQVNVRPFKVVNWVSGPHLHLEASHSKTRSRDRVSRVN